MVLVFRVWKIFTIIKDKNKMVEPSHNGNLFKVGDRNDASSLFDMTGPELRLVVAELMQRVQHLEHELEVIKRTVP